MPSNRLKWLPARFLANLAVAVAVITGLALLTDSRTANAKMYLRWNRGEASAILSGEQAGRTLFESSARLNGVRGQARVDYHEIGFAALRAEIMQSEPSGETGSSAMIWRAGTRHLLGTPAAEKAGERILLMDLEGKGGVLGIRFQPADRRRRDSGSMMPSGLPAYPGATVHWSLELDRSGLAVYAATAADHAAAVIAHVDRSLRNTGWQPAIETPNRPGTPAAGRYYFRDQAMLVLHVRPARNPGALTHLTVVHQNR